MGVLLEVAVAHERDVAGALAGGADRLSVATADGGPLEPVVVSAICREAAEAGVPVFAAVERVAQARTLLDLGVAGVSAGFLDADLEVSVDACAGLADVPWVFTALDRTLEPRRAWRRLVGLPGLVGVQVGGIAARHGRGVRRAAGGGGRGPGRSRRSWWPGPGLLAEHVPWLVRAGVRSFHVDLAGAAGRQSWRSYVDAALTRSWRLLLDDAMERIQWH